MNRLMKAEWYKVTRSSGLMRWLLFICVIDVTFPFLMNWEIYKMDLTRNLWADQEYMMMFVPVFLSVFSATVVGISYMNKTAYYEVMAGTKISHILLSKVMVNATLITVAVSAFLGIYWTIIGVCNGKGEIKQLSIRFVLLFLLFYHICATGILIVTSVRQIMGAALAFIRFAVVEMVILVILQIFGDSFSTETVEKIVDWFTMMKFTKILSYEYEITDHLIFAVIAGMLLEAGIWYMISYMGMRKRIYK